MGLCPIYKKALVLHTTSWLKKAQYDTKITGMCIALHGKPIAELRSVTCHMGSHRTQVNVSDMNLIQAGWYLICLPWKDRRLS